MATSDPTPEADALLRVTLERITVQALAIREIAKRFHKSQPEAFHMVAEYSRIILTYVSLYRSEKNIPKSLPDRDPGYLSGDKWVQDDEGSSGAG